MPKAKDPEVAQFERDLLHSIEEMKRGESAAIHTPAQIAARKRGRPAGSVKPNAKVSTTIRLSPEVLAFFRAAGDGWQSRVDGALKEYVAQHSRK
ncbi:BrnA antitoxin family protein [Variovorax saccharolyticus]|uniref:BrnA antitoxin family protein n=1 Tax=Variovorax saccharolyticus TaxID=3053516 RepID=UPI0025764ABC|nr:BrnA antitoxin family protein [Variovorax sp. J31P216]MDM0029485.1 BrnA antitoxin family protein [Variovorax sp. J31P216]